MQASHSGPLPHSMSGVKELPFPSWADMGPGSGMPRSGGLAVSVHGSKIVEVKCRYFCPECSWFWEHGGKRQVDTPALSGATRHREKLPPGVFWTVVIEKEETWASGAV